MATDVAEAVTARYYAGWRPSQHVARMWEKAAWDLPPDTPAPDPDDPEADDPEREPMTADEAAFLVANDAQFKTEE